MTREEAELAAATFEFPPFRAKAGTVRLSRGGELVEIIPTVAVKLPHER